MVPGDLMPRRNLAPFNCIVFQAVFEQQRDGVRIMSKFVAGSQTESANVGQQREG